MCSKRMTENLRIPNDDATPDYRRGATEERYRALAAAFRVSLCHCRVRAARHRLYSAPFFADERGHEPGLLEITQCRQSPAERGHDHSRGRVCCRWIFYYRWGSAQFFVRAVPAQAAEPVVLHDRGGAELPACAAWDGPRCLYLHRAVARIGGATLRAKSSGCHVTCRVTFGHWL